LGGRGFSPLVPIDPHGLTFAGIVAIVCEIAFSGY
jgi:hypothetical protein